MAGNLSTIDVSHAPPSSLSALASEYERLHQVLAEAYDAYDAAKEGPPRTKAASMVEEAARRIDDVILAVTTTQATCLVDLQAKAAILWRHRDDIGNMDDVVVSLLADLRRMAA